MRLADGSGKQVRPANLEAADTAAALAASGGGGGGGAVSPVVMAFWGDARWSRTQLLGEIARGHWGLCKGSVSDVVTSQPAERHTPGLAGRLAFAPPTEMTEDFMRRGAEAMDAYHRGRLARGEGGNDGGGRRSESESEEEETKEE